MYDGGIKRRKNVKNFCHAFLKISYLCVPILFSKSMKFLATSLILSSVKFIPSSSSHTIFFPWIPNMSKSVLLEKALMSGKLPHLIHPKIFRLGILRSSKSSFQGSTKRERQCATLFLFNSSASTSYSKLKNSTSFTTQILNSMKFNFECVHFSETQTR